MFNMGVTELLLILVIALIFFGPGKLPEIGRAVGKSLNEFKKATSGVLDDDERAKQEAPDQAKARQDAKAQGDAKPEAKRGEADGKREDV